jgi:hypothetical protein
VRLKVVKERRIHPYDYQKLRWNYLIQPCNTRMLWSGRSKLTNYFREFVCIYTAIGYSWNQDGSLVGRYSNASTLKLNSEGVCQSLIH